MALAVKSIQAMAAWFAIGVGPGFSALAADPPAPAADAPALAAHPPAPRGPLFHPDGPGRFRLHVAVGAMVDIVPRQVVQDSAQQHPRAAGWARFGLPWGFSVGAFASTDREKNELRGTAAWSYRYRRVSFGLQDSFGVWWGHISNDGGLDVSARSFVHQPGLAIGTSLNERVLVSLSAEAIYVGAQRTIIGSQETLARQGGTKLMGLSFTCIVENLIFRDQIIYYGAGILDTRPNYEEWSSFAVERTWLVYPRFVAGYAF